MWVWKVQCFRCWICSESLQTPIFCVLENKRKMWPRNGEYRWFDRVNETTWTSEQTCKAHCRLTSVESTAEADHTLYIPSEWANGKHIALTKKENQNFKDYSETPSTHNRNREKKQLDICLRNGQASPVMCAVNNRLLSQLLAWYVHTNWKTQIKESQSHGNQQWKLSQPCYFRSVKIYIRT